MISWIGGWSIPESHILNAASARFPNHEHRVILPTSKWVTQLPENGEVIVAYSLGSFLVLSSKPELLQTHKVSFLAPIIDIKSEADKGGRIATTQLKILLRLLKRNPFDAVNDFYKRSGLDMECKDKLPYEEDALTWGIEQLLNESADTQNYTSVDRAWVGSEDPLIKADALYRLNPETNVLSNTSHRLEELISKMEIQ